MKVAVAHWQGRIAPVFDVSDNLYLIHCLEGREMRREKAILNHQDLFQRAKEMVSLEIQMLICGAISYPLERALVAAGVRVIGFTCGDLEEVIGAFLNGSLTQPCFRMPGWVPREKATGCRRLMHRNRGNPKRGKNGKGVMFMPRGDKTGPVGQGPMTGRGAGPCISGPSKGVLGQKLTGGAGQSGFRGWFGLGLGRDRGGLSGLGNRRRWFNWFNG